MTELLTYTVTDDELKIDLLPLKKTDLINFNMWIADTLSNAGFSYYITDLRKKGRVSLLCNDNDIPIYRLKEIESHQFKYIEVDLDNIFNFCYNELAYSYSKLYNGYGYVPDIRPYLIKYRTEVFTEDLYSYLDPIRDFGGVQ